MRVFSSLLLVLSLAALAVSLWIAPEFRAASASIDTSRLFIEDPLERGLWAESEGALGAAISGYAEALARTPGQPEATNGILRCAARLAGAAVGVRSLALPLVEAFELYVANRRTADPDGAVLDRALEEFLTIRSKHPWYVGRGGLAIFLIGKGDPRGREIFDDLAGQAPLWIEWFPKLQTHLPAWQGLEPLVRDHLAREESGPRIFAAVTLMIYRGLYGVGEELWNERKDDIERTLLRAYADMVPKDTEAFPDTPGGMTLLGLALCGTPATRKIVEDMTRQEHAFLANVVTLAKLWAGLDDFSKIDFDNPRYSAWYDVERRSYYLGALLHYARLVRAGELEEARKLREGPLADALVSGNDTISILARRGLAAVHPEESDAIHRAMYDKGGVQRVYGVFGVSEGDRIDALLPALSSPDAGISALAIAGLLPPRGVIPIQMPVPKE